MTVLNKEKILEQAKLFIDQGKYDKAIREYEKLLLAEPSDLRIKLKIAELYTKRKQIAEAIKVYREVADAYSQEGFYLKAVTVHKNILRLNPSLIEINGELATLYEKMGLTPDAVRQYDILASALELKKQFDRVLEIRKKIVALQPNDGNSRIKLAELFQRGGKLEEAIDQYEEYARQLARDRKDKAKLADMYEKILSHRPDRYEMLVDLIHIFEEQGDFKKALKWLESSKEFVETNAELLRFMGKIYASQNQHETARAKYLTLAELLTEGGDIEGALDAYCEILVLLPDEEERLSKKVDELRSGAMKELLDKAAKKREKLEAEEIVRQEKAEAAKAEAKRQAAQAKDAAAAKASGTTKTATKTAAKESPKPEPKPEPKKIDRKDADEAYSLGMVYKRTGLADEAKEELTRALDIYSKCVESGNTDADIPQRIAEIESTLSK